MSLIHWWPLTTDLKDKLSTTSFDTPSKLFEAGKIGKALALQSTEAFVPNPFIGLNDWSIGFWIMNTGSSNWNDFLCFSGNKARIEVHNDNKSWTWFCDNTTSGAVFTSGTAISHSMTPYTWYHITIVKNGTNAKFYLNGSCVLEQNVATNFTNDSTAMYFNSRIGSRYANGRYNDIRCYNHALSKKEVQELSKALAFHLTFDSPDAGATTNKDPNGNAMLTQSIPEWSNSFSTATFGEYFGCKCFKITISGTNSGGWAGSYMSCVPTSYGFNVGDTVTRSCWIYVPSDTTVTGHFCESIEGGGSNQSFVQYDMNRKNTWQRVSSTVTIASTGHNMLHYFMADGGGGSFNFTFYIRDFQLELGNYPTKYTPSSRTALLSDNAGLYNITEITNYKPATDTAVGTCAGTFNKTSVVTDCTTNGWTELTTAAWVKPTSWNSGDQNAVIIGGIYLCIDSSQRLAVWCYGRNTTAYYTSSATIPLNKWTHIAACWHKDKVIGYINGAKALEVDCSGACTTQKPDYSGVNADIKFIGTETSATNSRAFIGYIDDVRIYGTALSEADIQGLCKTKKSIDRLGSVHISAYNEQYNTTSSVNSKSIQNANFLSEVVQLSDGSYWLQVTHHNNRGKKNLFSSGDAFSTSFVYHNDECWSDFPIIKNIGSYDGTNYEFFALEQQGTSSTILIRRWRQSVSPFTASWTDVQPGSSKVTHISNMPSGAGGMYILNSSTYMCVANSNNGNWYGAFGAWGTHGDGIPTLPNGSTSGIFDLYVRVSPANAQKYREMRGGIIYSTSFNEV